jgi:protein-S-isoprenylcysteine O-methyltransferase
MRAQPTSTEPSVRAPTTDDRTRRALTAVVIAVLIGAAGGFATPQVWILAAAGGLSFHSIARRGSGEVGTDRAATLLNVGFVAVLAAAAWDSRDVAMDPRQPTPAALAGLGAILGGLYLRRRALAVLGHHFSIKLQLRRDHRLVDSGPYRLLRHPNYTALVLVMLGTALVLHSPLALGAASLLWFPALLLRIGQEESALRAHLGEDYVRYSERTWRLVPGVY